MRRLLFRVIAAFSLVSSLSCLEQDKPQPDKSQPDKPQPDKPQPDKPQPDKAVDLRKVLTSAGYGETAYPFQLEDYVRFGTMEAGVNFRNGDQFDRLEIKKKIEPHKLELSKKRFLLNGLPLRVVDRDDVETKGLFVELSLPMRVRASVPFYKDVKSFSGSLSGMHPSEAYYENYWFMTKERTLKQCTPADAEILKKNNRVLYHPERGTTNLILIFKDKLDVLRTIARNSPDYSVEVELTNLELGRPIAWGFFRHDAYFAADSDCQKLWVDYLTNPIEEQPVYFPTAMGKDDVEKIPEIVRARLTQLKILDKGGKVVGGYNPPR